MSENWPLYSWTMWTIINVKYNLIKWKNITAKERTDLFTSESQWLWWFTENYSAPTEDCTAKKIIIKSKALTYIFFLDDIPFGSVCTHFGQQAMTYSWSTETSFFCCWNVFSQLCPVKVKQVNKHKNAQHKKIKIMTHVTNKLTMELSLYNDGFSIQHLSKCYEMGMRWM